MEEWETHLCGGRGGGVRQPDGPAYDKLQDAASFRYTIY